MKTLKDILAPTESKRSMFFHLGIIAATSLSLVAFKWTSYFTSERDLSAWTNDVEYILPEVIPVIKPSTPKTADKKPIFDSFEIVKELPEPKNEEPEIDPNPEKFAKFDPTAFGEPDEPEEKPIITNGPVDHWKVERMPYYNECSNFLDPEAESNCTAGNIVRHINKVLTYPAISKSQGIEGTVHLAFIIDETGKPTDIEVIRKVHPTLDKEAVRALSLIPPMNPAKQNGRAVSVRYMTQVAFKLKKY